MILLIGAGPMSVAYAEVLKALDVRFTVVGRSLESSDAFYAQTGVKPLVGGLDAHINELKGHFQKAIVCTGVEQLSPVSIQLAQIGVPELLIEKPAGLILNELELMQEVLSEKQVVAYVAYNRRFYASVNKALEIIEEDGGVENFNFEITEWGHTIQPLKKAQGVKENWFLGNTSHVTDLAFYLGGEPEELSSYTAGGLDWHSRAHIFSGAGVTQNGALFTYHGNWSSPGRWGVEVQTSKHRLILKPLEKLQIQCIGSVETNYVEVDDDLDQEFKPGLFKMVEAFITGNEASSLCRLDEQIRMVELYNQMAAYD